MRLPSDLGGDPHFRESPFDARPARACRKLYACLFRACREAHGRPLTKNKSRLMLATLPAAIAQHRRAKPGVRQWNPQDPPQNWKDTRNRWELFQGIRPWLLIIGFVLLCRAAAASN